MNRLVLSTSLAFVLSCGAAFAQTAEPQQVPAPQTADGQMHGHHHPDPARQAQMLSRRLNLTPDQTARIEPILAARDQQEGELHNNTSLSPQDRHAQMKAINESAEQAMAGVLSADQMAQLKAMRHQHHMRDGQGNGAPAPTA